MQLIIAKGGFREARLGLCPALLAPWGNPQIPTALITLVTYTRGYLVRLGPSPSYPQIPLASSSGCISHSSIASSSPESLLTGIGAFDIMARWPDGAHRSHNPESWLGLKKASDAMEGAESRKPGCLPGDLPGCLHAVVARHGSHAL